MKQYKIEPFISLNSKIDYEKELNPQQYDVVTKAEGPCLVLAGAGSGKTRVLIYRLAYLIEKGINPKNILLVTFTNKAAREMINRAEQVLKTDLTSLWVGTFHHIGNLVLRKEAKQLGFSSNFTIIDREDAKDLIQDSMEDLGLSKKGTFFPKKDLILKIYSFAINSLSAVDEIIKERFSHIEEHTAVIKRILAKFEAKKKQANVMDFSDLLKLWLTVLQDKETRIKYSSMFLYTLVDEYQDTNRLQFEILKRITSVHKNILAVGDDAQSIYSFRSAEIKNILDFPNIFDGTKISKLEINYRSTPQILELANSIINMNKNQFPKHLIAINKKGELPALVKTEDVYKQAGFVAQRITELYRNNVPLKEIAILFRSRYLALEVEVELMKRNIPYIIRGGLRFFEQAHIKDVLSYLKILVNPANELPFKRTLSLQSGIGRKYAYKIWKKLIKEKMSKEAILESLPKKVKQGFKEFYALFTVLQKENNPETALKIIIDEYKDYCYTAFDNPDDRLLDLQELSKMAKNRLTIKDFLEDLSAFEEFKGETLISTEDKEDTVVMSTIHQAKGLEWHTVFIVGCNEYDFPHPKALNSQESLEEERRLFYVATTRAKKHLNIIYPEAKYTYRDGLVICRPSMFIHEIPSSMYEEWDTT
jgi:DNA helicase II / ATP-dependent DNA helicase PcrA